MCDGKCETCTRKQGKTDSEHEQRVTIIRTGDRKKDMPIKRRMAKDKTIVLEKK